MASVFWDACGIIYIDYLEKGRTITVVYYAALLYHDDNVPSRTSIIAQTKKHELGLELFSHPPYSSDLPQRLIFFQTSKDGSVVSVYSQMKKSNVKLRRIFKGWRNRAT